MTKEIVPCQDCGQPQAGPAPGIGWWCENNDCPSPAKQFFVRLRAAALIQQFKDALAPFAAMPLSTEPEFQRTRRISLEDYDANIRRARELLDE